MPFTSSLVKVFSSLLPEILSLLFAGMQEIRGGQTVARQRKQNWKYSSYLCFGLLSATSPCFAGYWQIRNNVTTSSSVTNSMANDHNNSLSSNGWKSYTAYSGVVSGQIPANLELYNFQPKAGVTASANTSTTVLYRLHWVAENVGDLPPKSVIVYDYVKFTGFLWAYNLEDDHLDAAITNAFTLKAKCNLINRPFSIAVHAENAPDGSHNVKEELFGSMRKMYVLENPEQLVNLPLPHLWGSITMGFADIGTPVGSVQAYSTIERFLSVPPFVLEARPVGAAEYSEQVHLAAGGIDSIAVSDVRVRFPSTADMGEPYQIVLDTLDNAAEFKQQMLQFVPKLLRGNGVTRHSQFIPGPAPSPDPSPVLVPNTIYLGMVKTSDKALTGQGIVPTHPVASDTISSMPTDAGDDTGFPTPVWHPIAAASVVLQHWDEHNEWKSGANGDEPYNSYINYDEATPLTFKPKFGSSPVVPITGHTINFLVTKVTVLEWNGTTGQQERHTYTSNQDDAVGGVEYKANLGTYASFAPDQTGDLGGGAYRSSLTVPYDPENIVENLTIAAEDDETYGPE